MSQADIYTVSRLNSEVRLTLELQFRQLWLVGEVSNFIAASSGHWYFSLKDQAAQVKVAMFKQSNRYASLQPKNGQQILIRARISVYEPRGEYQLLADMLEPAGDGLLKQQYEQIKATLAAEGLLAPERKKPLPKKVQKVGVVTSPTGAAIRDIITVLKRRAPALEVIIYPCLVQGTQAPAQIYNAIQKAITRNEVDVLLIGRGGGSLEDLWCFNDEQVARLIAHCPIPTVSAVGHEIDFTIADFVADVRAATPSAAAELVSPDQQQQLQLVQSAEQRLQRSMQSYLRQQQPRLTALVHRLTLLDPARRLQQQQQYLDELQMRLQNALLRRIDKAAQQQQFLQHRLQQLTPLVRIKQQQQKLSQHNHQLHQSMQQLLKQKQQQWLLQSSRLHTVSPLATLERGYSISFDEQQQVITDASSLAVGQQIKTQLAKGHFIARIEQVSANSDATN
ncbi:exodeoxyribonuclease VII large subunit [Rheinheimera sediminis]|uniref:exodeoxyribonuclease VII large subunit n=1 Tax=Rheinheimera sp. YQF-1 TaxID=2499626 RepID=UPI000FDAE002|nr:exodeoxyribonuclease VII large subunit [Rheinheimera sp. YQF-1]RVT48776.1 exodeoxyribonuclease VII large subunit [Rheinheimera sp. YQF-1]